jgi:hypothetical protein
MIMNSSKSTTPKTLATDFSSVKATRFLVELLNLREADQKALDRFVKRFSNWLPSWHDIYTPEARSNLEASLSEQKANTLGRMNRETIGDRQLWVVYPSQEERLGDALAVRRRLRTIWVLPTLFLREFEVLDLLALRLNASARIRLLGPEADSSSLPNVFNRLLREMPVRLFGLEPLPDPFRLSLDPFTRVLIHCMHSADKLRVCQNTDCPAPYFIAQRRSQKYCSEKCAQPSQREFKLRWWDEHGEARRKARKGSAKKSRRKRGVKT